VTSTHHTQLQILRSVAARHLSLEAGAAALNVTAEELSRKLELLELAGAISEDHLRTVTRRAVRAVATVLALLTLSSTVWFTRTAWAAGGTCPNGLPFCFAPNQPAIASQMNNDFAQLKEWVEAKVGTVAAGSPSTAPVQMSSASVTGTQSFGGQVRQMVNLFDLTYGIGVQNSTLYQRSGGGFAWYKDGTHSDAQNNSGGGSTLMALDSNSNLTVLSVNGRRPAYVMTNNCTTGTCTQSCGAGVVKQAWGFHGFNGMTGDSAEWKCGSGAQWLGHCVGQSSCSVGTGCGTSSIWLECW
jgi:hypothetical protein